jgi:hypothetical protein
MLFRQIIQNDLGCAIRVDDVIHVADGGVRQWEALGHPVELPGLSPSALNYL